MKKRILALALALIMVISLLPVTALAADTPMPKVTVKGNGKQSIYSRGITGDSSVYIQTVDGQLVLAEEEPADNYMKFSYNKADNVLEILFKNIDYRPTVAESALLTIAGNTNYTAYFDVVLTLEGTNVIESTSTGNELSIGNYGTCTITGSGSLRFVSSLGSGAPINRNKTSTGELIIKDTTLYLENTYGSSSTAVIINNNQVTIENADVTLNGGPKNRGIVTSTKWNTAPTNAEHGVTIKNSDFVYVTEGSAYGIWTVGSIVFENSNIQMDRGEGNNGNVFNRAPTIIGPDYSEISWKATAFNKDGVEQEWLPYADLGLEPGEVLDTVAKLRHFRIVHNHICTDCTKFSICPCNQFVFEPIGTSHSFTNKASIYLTPTSNCIDGLEYYVQCDNCEVVSDSYTVAGEKFSEHLVVVEDYVAPTCTEPGSFSGKHCERCGEILAGNEEIPALGHLANADDGDCTTAITCQRCDDVVVAGKENHTIATREELEKDASCLSDGYKTVYTYCSDCKTMISSEIVTIPAKGHTIISGENVEKDATCVEPGSKTVYTYCSDCKVFITSEVVEIPATGHTEKIIPGFDATCTESGLTDGKQCTVCGVVTVAQETIDALGHTEGKAVLDEETNELVTSCATCGKELKRVPADCQHEEEIIPGVEATCTEDGLTEGVKCTKCDKILVPQQVIPAKGHTHVVELVEPTMYQKGYTLHTCACGDEYKTDEVARLHYVALIGKVRYATLQDAIDAANPGAEIELASDVTYGATIVVNKDVTIDLNGYTYAVSEVKYGTVLSVESGNLKLTSTGGVGELIARYDNYEKFSSVITNNGALTIENVVVNGNNLFVAGAATIINNGTVAFGDGAELNVNYKTKIALVNNAVEAVAENVKVNAPQGYYWAPANYTNLYAVAVNGNKLYTSLQAAIDHAANGDEVVLTENVNKAATLIVPEGKVITINLGGHYYAVKEVEQGAALVIGANAKVTLTNGKLDAMYAAYERFDCVVLNNGELTVENATINGNNLFNAGAAAIVSNGTLTKGVGTVITVKKAAEVIDV